MDDGSTVGLKHAKPNVLHEKPRLFGLSLFHLLG